MIGIILQQGIKEIVAHKGKSFLTMLGVMIGVMSVILINGVGTGAQNLFLNQITSSGTNLISILPGRSDEAGGPPAAAQGIVITTLTAEDAIALEDNPSLPHVLYSGVYVRGSGTLSYQNRNVTVTFAGTRANKNDIEDANVASGRFFSLEEEKSIAKVIVLGSQIKSELFGDQSSIGERVKINNQTFLVIGVMEPRGQAAFQNQDTQVFIPYTTVQKLLLGINYVNTIRVKVTAPEVMEETIGVIKVILRNRHGFVSADDDDFTVFNNTQGLETLTGITNGVKFFLAAIAAISLIVGGIGITNIMLISVRERVREIGLRKAIGARKRHILLQFLLESILLTSIGGGIGIILGELAAFLVAQIALAQGFKWEYSISVESIVIAVGLSVAIGILSGVYPASKAANLDPISALRYE